MARPKKSIDPEQVRKLAAIDCSYAEMAAVLGCNAKTLTNRFSQAIEKGREEGRASLKRKQFELAMAGNPTMLIWLGKIRLGQRDYTNVELTGKDGQPLMPMEAAREAVAIAEKRGLTLVKDDGVRRAG